MTPKEWAEKLYSDLAFAAPELWLEKITYRFEQAIEEARSVGDAIQQAIDDPIDGFDAWRQMAEARSVPTRPAGDQWDERGFCRTCGTYWTGHRHAACPTRPCCPHPPHVGTCWAQVSDPADAVACGCQGQPVPAQEQADE